MTMSIQPSFGRIRKNHGTINRMVDVRVILFAWVLAGNLASCEIAHAAPPMPRSEPADQHHQWLRNCLAEIEQIKIGSTREDLLQVFKESGGFWFRTSGTYIYRKCPYILLDVEFKLIADKHDRSHGRPTDTITKLSKPYLGYPAY